MMSTEAPLPKDIGDVFCFKQSRKLVIESDATISDNLKSTLTVSNKYGLVFVSYSKGVKVFKLDDILKLDKPSDQRSHAKLDEIDCCELTLNAQPVAIALSCDDLSLAVCSNADDGCSQVTMYDTRLYADKISPAVPFANVRLSNNPATEMLDFNWNPAQPGMFAALMNDGSITVVELNDTGFSISGVVKQSKATSICWSPKGKQLVAGQSDTSLIQYKPNMVVAKTIPAATCFEGPPQIINICWLSSFLFAAVLKRQDGNSVKFVMISTPKGGAVSYTDYDDPLLAMGTAKNPFFFINHILDWNMLIIGSNTAVETAVICQNQQNKNLWEQWILEDTGRAELPMIESEDSYATGQALCFAAQSPVPISDQLTVPAAPVLLLMSTNGILSAFHAVNMDKAAAQLVSKPQLLTVDGVRKSNSLSAPAMKTPSTKPAPLLTSTPQMSPAVVKTNLMDRFNEQKTEAPTSTQPQALTATTITQPAVFSLASSTQPISTVPKTITTSTPAVSKPAAQPAVSVSKVAAVVPDKQDVKKADENILACALHEEVMSFQKELSELSIRNSKFKPNLGTMQDQKKLKEGIQSIENSSTDNCINLKSLNNEIVRLKNILLESFRTAEEARSVLFRNNDKKYVHLLKARALNPVARKQRNEIQCLYQYVDHQLDEVHDMLELQWQQFVNKNNNSTLKLSSAETIYKSLKNINQVAYQQKLNLINLQSLFSSKPMLISSFPSADGELSKMADSLLNITKDEPESTPRHKNMSPEKITHLKDHLSRRKITQVQSSRPQNLSESKFLSSFMEASIDESQVENDEDKSDVLNTTSGAGTSAPPMFAATSTPIAKGNVASPKPLPAPVYEDITPPETPVIGQAVGTKAPAASQSATRGLFSGGSISSAFSAPSKPSESASPATSVEKHEPPKTSLNTPATKPTFSFTTTQMTSAPSITKPFSFSSGAASTAATPAATSTSFSFHSIASNKVTTATVASSQQATKPLFTTSTKAPATPTSVPASISFSFGSGAASTTQPLFSSVSVASSTPTTKPLFSSSSSGIAFSSSSASPFAANQKPATFSFQPQAADNPSNTKETEQPIATTFKALATKPLFPASTTSTGSSIAAATKPLFSTSSASFSFSTAANSSQFAASQKPAIFSTADKPPTAKEKEQPVATTPATFKALATKPLFPASTTASELPSAATVPKTDAEAAPKTTPATFSFGSKPAASPSFQFKLPDSTEIKPVASSTPSAFTFGSSEDKIGKEVAIVAPKEGGEFKDEVPAGSTVIEVSTKTGEVIAKPVATTAATATVSSTVASVTTATTTTVTSSAASTFSFSLGQSSSAAASSTGTLSFGSTTAASSPFGQATAVTTITASQAATTTTPSAVSFGSPGQTGLFGSSPASSFSFAASYKENVGTSTPSSTPSLFGNTQAAATGFGLTSTASTSVFGSTPATTSASGFGSTFGATPTSSVSGFGSTATSTPSAFGSAAVPSSTGGFGSTPTSGFGSVASSSASTFSFGNSNTQSTDGFGSGAGMFCGLGGKPSEENANKNVFGGGASFGTSSGQSSIFGNQPASSGGFGFSSNQQSSTPSFASTQAGVGQTGFGGFGLQQSSPSSVFGGAASFGGSPGGQQTFGGGAVFGSNQSSFGNPPQMSHVFGSNSQNAFASAQSSTPSFGALASQSPPSGFAAMASGAGASAAPSFGTLVNQSSGSGFGAQTGGFGSPASGFGSPTQTFGSPGFGASPQSNNSSFSKWRG